MQVLCGLQGIFLIFNCQTPVRSPEWHGCVLCNPEKLGENVVCQGIFG